MRKQILIMSVYTMLGINALAQDVSTLNLIFSNYSSSIKVSNPQNTKDNSCIYNTNYLRAELRGNYVVFSFGFAWDASKREYIDTDVLKINLRTATFCTGWWSQSFGKWQHGGDKSTLFIQDKANGMDLAITGCKSYNQGTKNIMIDQLWFSFGSEALANRVLNEIYNIQAGYKEKEPWLRPKQDPDPAPKADPANSQTKQQKKMTVNTPTSENNEPKRIGIYVQ